MAKKEKAVRVSDEKKFQQEDDLRTIRRAEEIKSNVSRMRGVRKLAAIEVKALKKIGKGKK